MGHSEVKDFSITTILLTDFYVVPGYPGYPDTLVLWQRVSVLELGSKVYITSALHIDVHLSNLMSISPCSFLSVTSSQLEMLLVLGRYNSFQSSLLTSLQTLISAIVSKHLSSLFLRTLLNLKTLRTNKNRSSIVFIIFNLKLLAL